MDNLELFGIFLIIRFLVIFLKSWINLAVSIILCLKNVVVVLAEETTGSNICLIEDLSCFDDLRVTEFKQRNLSTKTFTLQNKLLHGDS